MRANLRDDLTAALKARDRVAVAALRSALAAIENAEAVPVSHELDSAVGDQHFGGSAGGLGAAEAERRHLTEADLRAIVGSEVRERVAAAAEYEGLGQPAVAERLRAEAQVLDRYLAS